MNRLAPVALAVAALAASAAFAKESPTKKPAPGGAPSAECQKPSREIPNANECTVRAPAECVAAAGGGKLQPAKSKVYEATKDITVYRVYGLYDAPLAGGNRLTGAWWTLSPVREASKDEYASNYAVCRDWNAMKHLARCRIKKGARFTYGDGQSLFLSTCKPSTEMPLPSKWVKTISGKQAIAPPATYKQVCIPQAGNRVFYTEAGHKKPVFKSAAGVNLDVECDAFVVKSPPSPKF